MNKKVREVVAKELLLVAKDLMSSREYKFESKGSLHRNVLLQTLEDMGIKYHEYETSTSGITPLTNKAKKIIDKLFKNKVASPSVKVAISNTRFADEMLDWINDGGDWRDVASKHRVALGRAIKIFEREYDMHPDDV